MKPTIKQIAELSGVSRGTVDRALHNRGRIDPQVAERIVKIAESLNYKTSKKNDLPSRKIRIGFVTFLSERVFSGEINKGIEVAKEELAQWGIEVLIEKCISMNDADQLNAIDKLMEKDVSGLALMPIDSEAIRTKLNALSDDFQIPTVTFNTDIVGTKRISFIGMDNKKSGRVAAGLMSMLTQGVGSVLIITGSFANHAYSQRVDGFVEELKLSCPSLKIAGVHCAFDDMKEMEMIIENAFLSSAGIAGILVTSAGQDGVEAAFQKLNLNKRPYVVFYDLTPCTISALSNNMADFVIEQDCFSQGYNAAYTLANILVKKQYPQDEFLYTDIKIKNKYNI